MRSRPTSSRRLFVLVLAAIVIVFLIGRLWIQRNGIQRNGSSDATEAGLIPPAPPAEPPNSD